MKNLRNILLSIIALVIIAETSYSQDLKAGIIHVQHISNYTYGVFIDIYYETSTYINRPFYIINWGDGSHDTIFNQNNGTAGCEDTNTITRRIGKSHTYQSPGNYNITYVDSFRVSGINNINNSENEKLYLQYNLIINPFWGINLPPAIPYCAVEKYGCCPFIYNVGASDPDEDSLVYSMVPPYTTNYTFPPYTINNVTGDFILYPTTIGKYAFSMKIDEWRHDYLIGSTYQEMLIEVASLSSVEDNNVNNQIISIFPNPATNYFKLITNNTGNQTNTVNIYTIEGVLIKQVKYTDNEIVIETNEFPAGIFIIELKTKENSCYKKVVITK